jgi:hypothetical protein
MTLPILFHRHQRVGCFFLFWRWFGGLRKGERNGLERKSVGGHELGMEDLRAGARHHNMTFGNTALHAFSYLLIVQPYMLV